MFSELPTERSVPPAASVTVRLVSRLLKVSVTVTSDWELFKSTTLILNSSTSPGCTNPESVSRTDFVDPEKSALSITASAVAVLLPAKGSNTFELSTAELVRVPVASAATSTVTVTSGNELPTTTLEPLWVQVTVVSPAHVQSGSTLAKPEKVRPVGKVSTIVTTSL